MTEYNPLLPFMLANEVRMGGEIAIKAAVELGREVERETRERVLAGLADIFDQAAERWQLEWGRMARHGNIYVAREADSRQEAFTKAAIVARNFKIKGGK